MKKLLIIFSLFLTISCKEDKVSTKVTIVNKFTSLSGGYTKYNIVYKDVNSSKLKIMYVMPEEYVNLEKGYTVTLSINN